MSKIFENRQRTRTHTDTDTASMHVLPFPERQFWKLVLGLAAPSAPRISLIGLIRVNIRTFLGMVQHSLFSGQGLVVGESKA